MATIRVWVKANKKMQSEMAAVTPLQLIFPLFVHDISLYTYTQ